MHFFEFGHSEEKILRFRFRNATPYHFKLLICNLSHHAGVSSVKESVKLENYVAGRLTLGLVCHTLQVNHHNNNRKNQIIIIADCLQHIFTMSRLQDFYSHSNWVELGNKAPYGVLIQPDRPLEKLAGERAAPRHCLTDKTHRPAVTRQSTSTYLPAAGPDTPTCRNCTDGKCENNILPDLVQQQLLTSGYFSFRSAAKPQGRGQSAIRPKTQSRGQKPKTQACTLVGGQVFVGESEHLVWKESLFQMRPKGLVSVS